MRPPPTVNAHGRPLPGDVQVQLHNRAFGLASLDYRRPDGAGMWTKGDNRDDVAKLVDQSEFQAICRLLECYYQYPTRNGASEYYQLLAREHFA